MSAWTPPYRIEATKQPTGEGTWSVSNVEILGPDEKVVGSYRYNYSQKPPFFPFELDGQWYALYSRDYTATRIMKLPSCEDVWGQERDTFGFCPVEFYVPSFQNVTFGGDRTGKFAGTEHDDPEDYEEPHFDERHNWTVEPVTYRPFGFVSGCVWGDDSSWKVRFLDLSRIVEGIVVYDERFGYVELHRDLSLAKSVRYNGGKSVWLCVEQEFSLEPPKPSEPSREAAE